MDQHQPACTDKFEVDRRNWFKLSSALTAGLLTPISFLEETQALVREPVDSLVSQGLRLAKDLIEARHHSITEALLGLPFRKIPEGMKRCMDPLASSHSWSSDGLGLPDEYNKLPWLVCYMDFESVKTDTLSSKELADLMRLYSFREVVTSAFENRTLENLRKVAAMAREEEQELKDQFKTIENVRDELYRRGLLINNCDLSHPPLSLPPPKMIPCPGLDEETHRNLERFYYYFCDSQSIYNNFSNASNSFAQYMNAYINGELSQFAQTCSSDEKIRLTLDRHYQPSKAEIRNWETLLLKELDDTLQRCHPKVSVSSTAEMLLYSMELEVFLPSDYLGNYYDRLFTDDPYSVFIRTLKAIDPACQVATSIPSHPGESEPHFPVWIDSCPLSDSVVICDLPGTEEGDNRKLTLLICNPNNSLQELLANYIRIDNEI